MFKGDKVKAVVFKSAHSVWSELQELPAYVVKEDQSWEDVRQYFEAMDYKHPLTTGCYDLYDFVIWTENSIIYSELAEMYTHIKVIPLNPERLVESLKEDQKRLEEWQKEHPMGKYGRRM